VLGRLSWRPILAFYVPLAGNAILMTVEQPVATAGISRLPGAEPSLAAWGVAMAVATIVGLPINSLLHSSNALGRSPCSYTDLKVRCTWRRWKRSSRPLPLTPSGAERENHKPRDSPFLRREGGSGG
jgi:hypothetical protein